MKIIIALVIVIFSSWTNAASVSIQLQNEKINILNGRSDGEYIIPNSFETPTGLLKTNKWVPGTFAATTDKLVLTSMNGMGEKVVIPAKLAGAIYSQSTSFSKVDISSISGVPFCRYVNPNSSVTVLGDGEFCLSNSAFELKIATRPFQKFKPILKINKSDIISAFSGAVPEGVYTGMISGTMRYGFYANVSNGALTYRNIPVNYSVSIDVKKDMITKLNVLGTGYITPKYNTSSRTADGHTGYKISLLGSFNSGIRFKFVSKDLDDYTLKPSKTMRTGDIPYSINCNGCSSISRLVTQGKEEYPNKWHEVDGKGTSIHFDLDIFYENISVDDVESDTYQDNFILMFEAQI